MPILGGRHYALCCKPDRLETVPRVGSCAARGLGGCGSREDALSSRSGVHIEEPVRNTLQYRFDGPEDAPVLILGPSLGTTWHRL